MQPAQVLNSDYRSPQLNELITHAVKSINNAEYSNDPFPHIFFNNFFPDDFYFKLINNLPQAKFNALNADQTRYAQRIYGDHIEDIDPSERELWQLVSALLMSHELETATRNLLEEGMVIRAKGDNIADHRKVPMFAKPVIYSDMDGYEIKPHPDTRKKVVTMQLYCPIDESQKELGTTLYQASLKGLLNYKSYFLNPVKKMPFLPNVGYAFVVLKHYHTISKISWHGRPKIAVTGNRPRVSILNTFYSDESGGY